MTTPPRKHFVLGTPPILGGDLFEGDEELQSLRQIDCPPSCKRKTQQSSSYGHTVISKSIFANKLQGGAVKDLRLFPISRVSRLGYDQGLGILDPRRKETQHWRRRRQVSVAGD